MQCNPQYYVTGPPNCPQLCPCNPTYPPSYNSPYPDIIGEGEVVSTVLPDGTVQLYFLPISKWNPYIQNPSLINCNPYWNPACGAWFVKSIPNWPPQSCTQFVQQPCNFPSLNNPIALPQCSPYQIKFHNDSCTSTTDFGYFCPRDNANQSSANVDKCCCIEVVNARCSCGHLPRSKGISFESSDTEDTQYESAMSIDDSSSRCSKKADSEYDNYNDECCTKRKSKRGKENKKKRGRSTSNTDCRCRSDRKYENKKDTKRRQRAHSEDKKARKCQEKAHRKFEENERRKQRAEKEKIDREVKRIQRRGSNHNNGCCHGQSSSNPESDVSCSCSQSSFLSEPATSNQKHNSDRRLKYAQRQLEKEQRRHEKKLKKLQQKELQALEKQHKKTGLTADIAYSKGKISDHKDELLEKFAKEHERYELVLRNFDEEQTKSTPVTAGDRENPNDTKNKIHKRFKKERERHENNISQLHDEQKERENHKIDLLLDQEAKQQQLQEEFDKQQQKKNSKEMNKQPKNKSSTPKSYTKNKHTKDQPEPQQQVNSSVSPETDHVKAEVIRCCSLITQQEQTRKISDHKDELLEKFAKEHERYELVLQNLNKEQETTKSIPITAGDRETTVDSNIKKHQRFKKERERHENNVSKLHDEQKEREKMRAVPDNMNSSLDQEAKPPELQEFNKQQQGESTKKLDSNLQTKQLNNKRKCQPESQQHENPVIIPETEHVIPTEEIVRCCSLIMEQEEAENEARKRVDRGNEEIKQPENIHTQMEDVFEKCTWCSPATLQQQIYNKTSVLEHIEYVPVTKSLNQEKISISGFCSPDLCVCLSATSAMTMMENKLKLERKQLEQELEQLIREDTRMGKQHKEHKQRQKKLKKSKNQNDKPREHPENQVDQGEDQPQDSQNKKSPNQDPPTNNSQKPDTDESNKNSSEGQDGKPVPSSTNNSLPSNDNPPSQPMYCKAINLLKNLLSSSDPEPEPTVQEHNCNCLICKTSQLYEIIDCTRDMGSECTPPPSTDKSCCDITRSRIDFGCASPTSMVFNKMLELKDSVEICSHGLTAEPQLQCSACSQCCVKCEPHKKAEY